MHKDTYDISAEQARSALAFDPGRHGLVHIVASVFVSLIFSLP
jgi:CRISPR/Cas system-associated endoribonuclease Cas2